jgi:2-polyprenyl-3-methyl-5-hydroxy-6-metoxy-1,4-benzoquinol methylase
MSHLVCRFCACPLSVTFADLGTSPLSNSYVRPENVHNAESVHPLHVRVCQSCFLVQLPLCETAEAIFSDYAYFSSYSDSWLAHCKKYADEVVQKFDLPQTARIVEVASNDGYLLQFFKEKKFEVLGIEPAQNVARVAQEKGIPTVVQFLGASTADELRKAGHQADLLIGNNVLAHVPDLNDFIIGLKTLLNDIGVLTLEFPHLLQLMIQNQFDTIYHEHFSYFSLMTVEKIFAYHGLTVFDVQEVPTHGGSLRLYVKHAYDVTKSVAPAVAELIQKERDYGLDRIDTYRQFGVQVERVKSEFLSMLADLKKQGKKVVGYGAPAKGNTLLNYCGVRTDMISFTVDRSPHKQGLFLPGTHIPIYHPDEILAQKPDYIVILPWNIKDEIMDQLSYVRQWDAKFIVPIPITTIEG